MILLQNYITNFFKYIMISSLNFQMLKKESWVISMILLNYILKDMIIVCSQKKRKEESTDKEEFTDVPAMLPQEGDGEEVKERNELKI